MRASDDRWTRQISPGDVAAYEANRAVGTGYVDDKMTLCGRHADGWLPLHLHRAKEGAVVVCEPSYGWERPESVASLRDGAEFRLGAAAAPVEPAAMLSRFCVRLVGLAPRGGSILSVRARTDKAVCVSFVLWT